MAVDDVKVNGKLTLGENTADNGGLRLAYIALMSRLAEGKPTATTEEQKVGAEAHPTAAVLSGLRAELLHQRKA